MIFPSVLATHACDEGTRVERREQKHKEKRTEKREEEEK